HVPRHADSPSRLTQPDCRVAPACELQVVRAAGARAAARPRARGRPDRGRRGTVPIEIELTIEAGAGKRAKVNGAALRAAEQLRSETVALVFTPDRLGVVKGAPAARRAYFDRALGRFSPARAGLPAEYGAAVAQRNASLRRVAAGFSTRAALQPWTEQVVQLGAELVTARREVLGLLGPPFAERAA